MLPLLLVLLAGTLRLGWLSHPERLYFDEVYYANEATQLLEYGVEQDVVVHPPLGKWLIATGIAVLGDHPAGWRAASASAGTALVLVTYLLGARLFRRQGPAAAAALLVAVDGLALTMSRIAMLDAFLALFVALGVWCLMIDRDHRWNTGAGAGAAACDGTGIEGTSGDLEVVGHDRRLSGPSRRFRTLAGVAFGLALAVKLTALLVIFAAALFLLVSELAWRRAVTGRAWALPIRFALGGVTALLVLPAAVYVLSHAAWFANYEHTKPGMRQCPAGACQVSPVDMIGAWGREQVDILMTHREIERDHAYRAPATSWPVMARPVVYYYESCAPDDTDPCAVEPGNVAEILGVGNPAVWWLALGAYPLLAWAAVRRRDPVAATILVFLLAQYVPWLVVPRPLFFFYALPIVPFIALSLAWVADQVGDDGRLRWAPAVAIGLALVSLAFWAPVWYGLEISEQVWRMRIVFDGWI